MNNLRAGESVGIISSQRQLQTVWGRSYEEREARRQRWLESKGCEDQLGDAEVTSMVGGQENVGKLTLENETQNYFKTISFHRMCGFV